MADTREIIVKLYDNPSSNTGDAADPDEIEKKRKESIIKTITAIAHPINTLESSILGKNLWARNIYDNAKQLLTQVVDTGISRYFKLNEDYIGEQNWQNAKQAISSFSSIVGSVASGAIAGLKTAGGYGAAIGAGVALSVSLSEKVYNVNNERANYYQSFNATLMQTDFDARRMSLIDNGRGTDN